MFWEPEPLLDQELMALVAVGYTTYCRLQPPGQNQWHRYDQRCLSELVGEAGAKVHWNSS